MCLLLINTAVTECVFVQTHLESQFIIDVRFLFSHSVEPDI